MIQIFSGQLKFVLLFFDLTAFWLAFHVAYGIRHDVWFAMPGEYMWVAILSSILMVIFFQRSDLYKMRQGFMEDLVAVIKSTVLTLLIILAILFYYRDMSYSRVFMTWLAPLLILFVISARWLFQRLVNSLRGVKPALRNSVVIGCGVMGQNLISELSLRPTVYHVVGFLDDNQRVDGFMGKKHLGGLNRLEEVITDYKIHHVFMAISTAHEGLLKKIVAICEEMNVTWRFVPNLYLLPFDDFHLDFVGKIPLIGLKDTNIVGINYVMKRFFDFMMSGLIIIAALPIILIAALSVKLSSRGPVLFTQKRIGLHGEPFDFFKFRTMFVNNDGAIHKQYVAEWIKSNEAHAKDGNSKKIYKIADDPRITKVGKWLRKFSIDELPQLFNVLRGDMSLIGPRPALPYEVEMYSPWHRKRLQAPPGITGLWQVSGRNALSFEEMLNLDISYINNWSFENDIRILLKTVTVVLFGKAY